MAESRLHRYVREIEETLDRWQKRDISEYLLEAPGTEDVPPSRHKLEWVQDVSLSEPLPGLPLDKAREELVDQMHAYTGDKGREVLLVRAKPGIGKTHAAVQLAQDVASAGGRVLYLMPNHAHFDTLLSFDHILPDMWYHWLSIDAPLPSSSPLDQNPATMCALSEHAVKWTGKGYPLKAMCDDLCPMWQHVCHYRRQRDREEGIIAGVHEHAAVGMSIDRFDLVILDELPVRAFLQERLIRPASIIQGDHQDGPLPRLLEKVQALTARGRRYRGRTLLDEIGPQVDEVYSWIGSTKDPEEILYRLEELLPAIPMLQDAEDVEGVGEWFFPTLLRLLVPEWMAWKAGAESWMSRVLVSPGGLLLLDRADPWQKLPSRIIALDATGSPEVYETLLHRECRVLEPRVKKRGRVQQIVNRLYGKSWLLDEGEVGEYGQEAIDTCRALVEINGYQRPAVVTFKAAKPAFEEVFGEGRVSHFYGQRGSNSLSDADALFVVGTPSPPSWVIMNHTAMLFLDRMAPYAVTTSKNGHPIPVRSEKMVPYSYQDTRGVPHRMVGGYWQDYKEQLETVCAMYREEEMQQALHRGRPMVSSVDVWMLSSVPTSERLDAIYEDPSEAIGAPEIPCTKHCVGKPSCRHRHVDGSQRRISWGHWWKIWRWLQKQEGSVMLTNRTLAEVAEVKSRQASQDRWLDAIVQAFPQECEVGQAVFLGGGGGKSATWIGGGNGHKD